MTVTTQRPGTTSGIGVLDKASILLDMVAKGPASLAQLVDGSGYTRPTVHRIARGMESLGLFARDIRGRFVLGPRLGTMAVEVQHSRLVSAAPPVLADLHTLTGFDAHLLRRRGAVQICLGTFTGTVQGREWLPVGTARSLKAGPVAQVLLAWEEPEQLYEGLRGARFTAAQLSLVRRRGWAYGPDSMAPQSVSLAVPVRAMGRQVVAALSLTGPRPRMPAAPDRLLLGAMVDAANELGDMRMDTAPVLRAHSR
nr:IclR family transcriptional regulator [Streptomyces atrovirens]